jgi:hypothetical protein
MFGRFRHYVYDQAVDVRLDGAKLKICDLGVQIFFKNVLDLVSCLWLPEGPNKFSAFWQ